MTVTSTFKIEMQLAGTAGAWTDVTEDVVHADGIHASYGINGSSPSDRVASSGALTFTMDNSANNSGSAVGYYSPGHASCRSGFQAGIPVRLSVVYDGQSYVKFYGRIPSSGIRILPGVYKERKVDVEVRDFMEIAATHDLYLPALQENKRMDEIVPAVVANMAIQPLSTDYDTGTDTFTTVFDTTTEATKAMTEFQKVAMSELGYVYVKPDNTCCEKLIAEGRMTRTNVNSLTYMPKPTAECGYLLNSATAAPELVVNPGFETVTSSTNFGTWSETTSGGTIFADDSSVHGGTAAARLSTPAGVGSTRITQDIAVSENTDYTLGWWTRGDSAAAGYYRVQDASHAYADIVGKTTTGVTGTAYTYGNVDFTSPAGCGTVRILLFAPTVAGGTAWFDDVSMTLSTPAGAEYLLQETGSKIILNEIQNINIENLQASMEVVNGALVGNIVRVTSFPRRIDTSATILYTLNSALEVKAGATKSGYEVTFSDPQQLAASVAGKNMIDPAANTDYTFHADSAGTGTDLTANLSVSATYGAAGASYTFTNNGTADGYITKLQARGYGIYTYDEMAYQVEDSTSKLTHGSQRIDFAMEYQDDPTVAESYASLLLAQYKDPVTEAFKVTYFANTSDENMGAFLIGDIGAKVHLVEDVSGIDGDYFVQGVEYTIRQGGIIEYTWLVKRASIDIYS